MKTLAIFDSHQYEKSYLIEAAKQRGLELVFFEERITNQSVRLAEGYEAISCFVNCQLNRENLTTLFGSGLRFIALRCAGFNNVDVNAAIELGIRVVRVPEYSPYAVAEFTIALILNLNRKLHKSYLRMKEMNFSLSGLVGFDLHGKTVGVVGTGKIGARVAQILMGFGCEVVAYDRHPDAALEAAGVRYMDLNELFRDSHVVSLHVPLTADTFHMINETTISEMKQGSLIINTGRGGLIDTRALIKGLKSKHLGGAALDVYEEEEKYFFVDHSVDIVTDDVLARLLTFPNVIVTSHQGFLTKEALENIADSTLTNFENMKNGAKLNHELRYEE